ncbi:flagellar FlbD family protein [Caldalkalibacillus salinus]|uniref:flagellar FlbD family protein n=1 Tax=Caldalkalibacillus salinus TaxID=2803787 RepID=UPI001923030B|nr:flagellar FlbD family protein [Caldalkalibacillus salinus]
MITLTRLNGQPITINAIYIERMEETPDTVLTLYTNRKIIVKESIEEVISKSTDFYAKINLFQEMKEVTPDAE